MPFSPRAQAGRRVASKVAAARRRRAMGRIRDEQDRKEARLAQVEAECAALKAALEPPPPAPLTPADLALVRHLADPAWAEPGERFGAGDISDVAQADPALAAPVLAAVGSLDRVAVGLWLRRVAQAPPVDGLRLVRQPDVQHAARWAFEPAGEVGEV